jgi:hypothetical protein
MRLYITGNFTGKLQLTHFIHEKKSTSQSAFFNVRVLIAALFCLAGIAVAVFGTGAFSSAFAQRNNNNSAQNQAAPGTQTPDVVRMDWSGQFKPRSAQAALHRTKGRIRKANPDAIPARDGAGSRTGRLRHFRFEICPDIAQKRLARCAEHAPADTDLRRWGCSPVLRLCAAGQPR